MTPEWQQWKKRLTKRKSSNTSKLIYSTNEKKENKQECQKNQTARLWRIFRNRDVHVASPNSIETTSLGWWRRKRAGNFFVGDCGRHGLGRTIQRDSTFRISWERSILSAAKQRRFFFLVLRWLRKLWAEHCAGTLKDTANEMGRQHVWLAVSPWFESNTHSDSYIHFNLMTRDERWKLFVWVCDKLNFPFPVTLLCLEAWQFGGSRDTRRKDMEGMSWDIQDTYCSWPAFMAFMTRMTHCLHDKQHSTRWFLAVSPYLPKGWFITSWTQQPLNY